MLYSEFYYFRGRMAAVFQEGRLVPWRTALDDVKLGLEIQSMHDKEARKISADCWRSLGCAGSLNLIKWVERWHEAKSSIGKGPCIGPASHTVRSHRPPR